MDTKKVYLIGIGPGDPKYLTLEAVEVIKRLNTFLIPLKKGDKEELTKIRKKVIEFCRPDKNFEIIELEFPERKKSTFYKESVEEWRNKKAEIILKAMERVNEAGFLVVGDPGLYDGHIEIFKKIQKQIPLEIEVIPGISSINVLSAKHKISLNKIAGTIIITTPRGLRKLKEISSNTVVLLDNYETFRLFKDKKLKIYWGAYLGTKKEALFSGWLTECFEKLIEIRRSLKEKHGWIMETYLLTDGREDE
jgi:precorrin-6A synthase